MSQMRERLDYKDLVHKGGKLKKILRKRKFRRIYSYECVQCHNKNRSTLVYKVSKEKICRSCRKKKIDKNQVSLFNENI